MTADTMILLRTMAWLSIVCYLTTVCAAKPRSEFSGDVDFTFSYNDYRSSATTTDANLYILSSLLNLELSRDVGPERPDSPWTGYVSYQLTGLDRYPDDRSGVEIDPYRYWLRYTDSRKEVRLGMQKLTFGHARYLRPLRLFDQINPNDFTKKTPGIEALRLKLFPRPDLQVQTWLVHNETNRRDVHVGGRVNKVYDGGEVALTFHHWEPDPARRRLGEDVFCFDAFADITVGLWFEHATHKVDESADYTATTLGLDYTFSGIGNGLHCGLEHLVTTDSSYRQLNRTSAFFFDTRLNDEDTLYGSYTADDVLGLRAVTMRLVRDMNETLNAELSIDWLNKSPSEISAFTSTALPLRKGISLRFVHSF